MPRRTSPDADVIPNQVFIGCPWKTVRPKFEKAFQTITRKYPLSFILIGRKDGQEAVDLLELIKSKIESSSFAIFDATGGNANVSLEFGYAEAKNVPKAIYFSTHRAARRASKDAPIIADIAGKKRSQYAQQRALNALLTEFAKNHNYTKRFETFMKKVRRGVARDEARHRRSLALAIIHGLDNTESIRRADLIQNVLGERDDLREEQVDDMIKRLHGAELIRCEPGRYSKVTIR